MTVTMTVTTGTCNVTLFSLLQVEIEIEKLK